MHTEHLVPFAFGDNLVRVVKVVLQPSGKPHRARQRAASL